MPVSSIPHTYDDNLDNKMDDLGSAYSYETDNLNDLVMAGQLDSKAQNNMMRLTDVKEDEE